MGFRNSSFKILLSTGLMTIPLMASAAGSVEVNGYTFYCQNTCVVSQNGGGLYVSDSLGGWVRIYTPGGRLPAPRPQ